MSKVRSIVKKWQRLARVKKVYTSMEVDMYGQSQDNTSSDCENEEFNTSTTTMIPKGYKAVYIGKSRRRYVINAQHLKHPLFRALWKRSQEFGIDQSLGVSLGCEVVLFDHLLWMLNTSDPSIDSHGDDSMHELAELYMPVHGDSAAVISLLHDDE